MKKIIALLLVPIVAFAQPTPPASGALTVNSTTGVITAPVSASLFASANNLGGGGGGSPGGSNTQVQFNDSGSFGGDSKLTFIKATGALSLTGAFTATSLNGLTLSTSTGTITITNAKVFSVTDNVTLSSDGTGTRTLNIGAGGTLGAGAFQPQTVLSGTANQIAVSNSGVGATTISIPTNPTLPGNVTVSGTGTSTIGGNLTVTGGAITANSVTSATGAALTLGTGTSGTAITVASASGNVTITPANAGARQLILLNANNAAAGTVSSQVQNYGLANPAYVTFNSRGTQSVPVDLSPSDLLGTVEFWGEINGGGHQLAKIVADTTASLTTSDWESNLKFYTTDGTTEALALTIGPTGAATFASTVAATAGTFSSLTSGRVPFASTGGLLTDAAAFTFNSGTGALSATSFVDQSGTIGKRTADLITQNSHGFSVGNVLYNANGTWTKAKADALSTTYALGVVESVTTNTFVIVYSGPITLSALTVSTVYYLSDATAGATTTTAPTSATSYVVPILKTGTSTQGYVAISAPQTLAVATVANGGTGATSFTAHGPLIGEGTNAIAAASAGTSGQLYQSAGSSSDPGWTTATYPTTASTSGKMLQSDGTNFVSTSIVEKLAIFTVDGAGSAITTTTVPGTATVPFAATITGWTISATAATGTNTVKFWKVATGTAIPTISNVINTSGVSLTTGTSVKSTTTSDFTTTAIAAFDLIRCSVTAVDGAATDLTVTLWGTR